MEKCNLPPHGWACTRPNGHEGPCAAHTDECRTGSPFARVRDEGCNCDYYERTAPSNANTSGLEVVAWAFKLASDDTWDVCLTDPRCDTSDFSAAEPLVTAASAVAAIDEQEETIESLKRLVDQHYDRATAAEARNAEVSMLAHRWMEAHDRLKAGLDYDLPTPADLPNEKARADRLAEIASKLSVAISWLDYPFIDNRTPEAELRQRVGFMMKDAEPHRAALQQEKQP